MKEYDSALSLLSSLTDKSQSLLLRQGFLDEFTDVLKSEEKEEELQRLKVIWLLFCCFYYPPPSPMSPPSLSLSLSPSLPPSLSASFCS